MSETPAPRPDGLTEFRKSERARLIAARLALPADKRAALAQQIADHLDRLVPIAPDTVVSLYWPFRGEPDLRAWMTRLAERGIGVALPVVEEKARPLIFRRWHPGCAMTRGVWNIPIPEKDDRVVPTVVLSPLVGVDRACFRLGYGGGFFDRTLAAMTAKPLVIGVGYELARIETIHPQPYDIPMDIVITAPDAPVQRGG